MPSGSVPKNRRHHRPASAPTAKVQPPAEEAEVRQCEAKAPEPADSAEYYDPAEHYDPAALASAGSASGSSPRPVPAEGVLAVKAPAEVVPADSSPGSAAVAVPAA